jgi:hypothetical protein
MIDETNIISEIYTYRYTSSYKNQHFFQSTHTHTKQRTHILIVDNHIIVGKDALLKDEAVLPTVSNNQRRLPGRTVILILVKHTLVKRYF